jgi:hypothetical protein
MRERTIVTPPCTVIFLRHCDVGGISVTTRTSDSTQGRTPLEAALRHLGARRYGDLVELIEYAIKRPDGRSGTILAPLIEPTSLLHDWSAAERAGTVWRVIEEGIVAPQVSSTAQSRRRHVLHAAFRLPDEDVGQEWGASLTDRFKQLRNLSIFGDATSTQPMEIAWKRGVERLARHLAERFDELRTPDEWARYRDVSIEVPKPRLEPSLFRQPSEGAQKLVVNLYVLTILMRGRSEARRISERLITSQEDDGLRYYTARAFVSASQLQDRDYLPTHALWGCWAEQVDEDGVSVTQLWFPRPLKTGEQAYFMSEAILRESDEDYDEKGWANVDVDHFGIEPGELRGVLPVSGLTIRIRFDHRCLPKAVWWYAELNESERYREPPPTSPRHLDVVNGDVVKTFTHACQPRESYGIAYNWP